MTLFGGTVMEVIMANVVTQIEMMKFSGMEKAVFPAGTILTPSAKDYAAENNIRVCIGEICDTPKGYESQTCCNTEKEKLLKNIIKSVMENSGKAGKKLSKEEVAKTVTACLERLGCRIDS